MITMTIKLLIIITIIQSVCFPSISDTVRRSVGIVHALTKYAEEGDKIIIETKNGEKRQLIITGME